MSFKSSKQRKWFFVNAISPKTKTMTRFLSGDEQETKKFIKILRKMNYTKIQIVRG